jgi:CheY-like chemotaxis protein
MMPLKVLLVDDEPDVLSLMAILLRRAGFEAKVAISAHEALAIAPMFMPDVVCLDLGMPSMSGYELAQRLRKIDRLARVCLMAVSGYAADDALLDAAGIECHLLKPLGIAQLKTAICDLLLKRYAAQAAV